MHPIEVSTKFLRMRWLLALKLTVFLKCRHFLCRSPRDKSSNKVKIHVIRYSNEYDECRDADLLANNEQLALDRYERRFFTSDQSLEDKCYVVVFLET